MRQFFLFLKWIPCKFGRSLQSFHRFLYKEMSEDGFIFVMGSVLLVITGFLLGLISGVALWAAGLYNIDMHNQPPIVPALIGCGITVVYVIIIGVQMLYTAFCREQNELFNKLKKDYHG